VQRAPPRARGRDTDEGWRPRLGDAGDEEDAAPDAGEDAGEVEDAALDDAAIEDSAIEDAAEDAAIEDAAEDAAIEDAGEADALAADADPPDIGVEDIGIDAGVPDSGCAADTDIDGVCDPDDNCPLVSNPLQEDTDGVAAFEIPYAPVQLTAAPPIPGLEGDDDLGQTVQLGFSFSFFGDTVSVFQVSTNGFVFFPSGGDDGCCAGQALPNTSQPNGLVAIAWTDLWPMSAGEITYEVIGAAPDRRLVVALDDVPEFEEQADTVTAQMIVYESDGAIEIHTASQAEFTERTTRGIENGAGTRAAYLPGQSRAFYSLTQAAVRFTTGAQPDGIGDACSNAH
jgi:hypothetical protein